MGYILPIFPLNRVTMGLERFFDKDIIIDS